MNEPIPKNVPPPVDILDENEEYLDWTPEEEEEFSHIADMNNIFDN